MRLRARGLALARERRSRQHFGGLWKGGVFGGDCVGALVYVRVGTIVKMSCWERRCVMAAA